MQPFRIVSPYPGRRGRKVVVFQRLPLSLGQWSRGKSLPVAQFADLFGLEAPKMTHGRKRNRSRGILAHEEAQGLLLAKTIVNKVPDRGPIGRTREAMAFSPIAQDHGRRAAMLAYLGQDFDGCLEPRTG